MSTIQKNSIKSARVDSHDRWFRSTHVSVNNFASVITADIRTEPESELRYD
jgi:hypothetical protein